MYLGVGQQIYQLCIYIHIISHNIRIHLKNMTMFCGPKLTPIVSALATCNKFHRLNSQDVFVSCVSRRLLLVETCFSTTWMSNSKTFWLKSLVPSENWKLVQGWVMILKFLCVGILEKMHFMGTATFHFHISHSFQSWTQQLEECSCFIYARGYTDSFVRDPLCKPLVKQPGFYAHDAAFWGGVGCGHR